MMSVHVLITKWSCGLVDESAGRMSFVQAGCGKRRISLLKKQQEMCVCFGWLLIFHFYKWLNALAENGSVAVRAKRRWASAGGSCSRKKGASSARSPSPVGTVHEIGHS